MRARRLARSSLSERASADRVVEVVSALCGVRAQRDTAAELQLCARIDGLTQAGVRDAIWERRALVKAWTLAARFTSTPPASWHCGTRRGAAASGGEGLPAWRDPQRVLHPELGANEVAGRSGRGLGGARRTLPLARRAHRGRRETRGSRGASAPRSGFAFFNSDLCQGPSRGARITLVRPDQWIDGFRDVD